MKAIVCHNLVHLLTLGAQGLVQHSLIISHHLHLLTTTVLQINTNASASGKSVVFFSGTVNLSRNCANSPMTVSFWMYRTGIDNNADKITLLVNNIASLTGATPLITVHRSRALTPTVYGLDGWYRYEATCR